VKRSSLWHEFESGDGFLLGALRFLILAGGLLFLSFSGALSLSWENQFALAALTLAAAIWMNSASKSHAVTLTLVLLSVYSTFRYAFWRASTAASFFRDPGTHWTTLDAVFIGMLLLAEGYACVVLVLGYVQVLWPLRRAPVPLPDDPKYWPAVDLLIPTVDEPLSVVRFTALAAMNIDWPADKLHVYILDDGAREEFREFAEEAGIGYMSRDDRRHAKAGNINDALAQLDSPFVAVFDCDHVPTRSFLQVTMGWLLRDQKLAMLQTPHHFYSPDPFERNLDQFRAIPNEDELYYGVVQDGNDFWNATCFCGSCAVLRRSALDEVGGVAVETLTEDAHTSVRLQRSGWNTAYINIPQAAGLATERLSAHIRQRVRWARGMVQILRTENPLFASGLNLAQRLCYFNAMLHFLFALPRLIFLVAPLIYLVFGRTSIPGFWAAIVAYAIPHLLLAHMTHSRIQGAHRHSFWNEIYETVLAPYILLPTLFALISPRSGKFQVTAKGGVVDQGYFDARIARPFLVLLALNFLGLLCAVARCVRFPTFAVSRWLSPVNWPAHLYDSHHFGIVAVNVAWALFNMTILGVAVGVSWETQQRRQSVRVSMAVPSDVILADGTMIQGSTADLSSGGVRTHVDRGLQAKVGDSIRFVFPLLDGTATLPATVVAVDGSELRARFDHLSLQEDEALTMLLYSRADSWLAWGKTREADNPLRSLARILRLSLRGLAMAVGGTRGPRNPSHTRLATSIAPFLLIAGLAGVSLRVARAAQDSGTASKAPTAASVNRSAASSSTANFDTSFTLADAGAPSTIALRGVDGSRSIAFSVPRNRLVKTATLKLRYRFSPGLLPGISQLNVSLNGSQLATLAVKAPSTSTADQGDTLEAALKLPAERLVADNQLTFEFIGHYTLQCEDPSNSTLWSQIDSSSTVELAGTQAPPGSDLSALPRPFLDSGVNPSPAVPIVFLAQPSPTAMQAAGVIASWFGIQNGARSLRFPVYLGTIPAGNVIVIAEHPLQLPPSLGPAFVEAAVAIRPNPSDPYSSVLLVTGDGADQVLTAARALALHGDTWQGPQVGIQSLTLPAPRQPDDAPRWISTDKNNVATVGQIAQSGVKSAGVTRDLQGDGSVPLSLTFRLPPDLDYGDRENLAFHMSYRYSGVPLAAGSTLQVFMNGNFVSSTPMPHTDKASAVLETVVPIPVVDLRPYANTLTFKFMFQAAKAGGCAGGAPTNLQGAILKDSYLDIAGIPHSVTLPNLELFANAGYPFTRRADLSDTTVVLPDQPSTAELEMFLAMMGHFGAQTGYPALNLTVTNAAGMTRDGSRDYLVLGTVEDQPALKSLDASLPVAEDEAGLHIRDTRGFFDRAVWWRSGETNVQPGQIATGGGLPDALIEELQWPAASNRSVVAVVLRDADSVPNFLAAFLTTSQSPEIAESVSMLHGSRFSSYRIGRDLYRVGEVSSLAPLTRALQSFPWLIAGMTLLLCFLMAVLIQARLRRHARTRLKGAE